MLEEIFHNTINTTPQILQIRKLVTFFSPSNFNSPACFVVNSLMKQKMQENGLNF